jgi:hypothetical protein
MEGDGDESLVNEGEAGEAEVLLSVTEVGLRAMLSECFAAWCSLDGVLP